MAKPKKKKNAAANQRRYRLKLKEQDTEAELMKERQRWHRRKAEGKIKPIADMTQRQQRATRKKWKKWRENRKRKGTNAEIVLDNNASDDNENDSTSGQSEDGVVASTSSRQKKCGVKIKRRNISSAYRRIQKLEKQVDLLERAKNKYKKRSQRKKTNKTTAESDRESVDATPRKKARKTISKPNREVRKILIFHFALLDQLKLRYSIFRKEKKASQILGKMFGTGSILKKYRVIQASRCAFGLSRKALVHNKVRDTSNLTNEPI